MMWEAGGSTASSSGAGGSGGGGDNGGAGRRKPSWRERENNRRRERRRRAVAAKIYAGLRTQGNYNLPKHCDNNEVLKSLCNEAGWIVEPDGTTYRKGSRPIPMEIGGRNSTNITPCSSRNPSPPSSYFASPIPSYNPSPSSSSFPSPTRNDPNPNPSTHPFAFLLNSLPSSLPPLRISNSAPVTPPLSSPTRHQLPKDTFTLETLAKESMSALNIPFFASSAPVSPGRVRRFMAIPECDERSDTSSTVDSGRWMSFRSNPTDMVSPNSPTFNLVKPVERMVISNDDVADKGKGHMDLDFDDVMVKPWEGERIHDVGIMDDLELTLGSGNARV